MRKEVLELIKFLERDWDTASEDELEGMRRTILFLDKKDFLKGDLDCSFKSQVYVDPYEPTPEKKKKIAKRPKYMVKTETYQGKPCKTVYEKTKYGSYVNISEYGMAQQKNAMSLKELKKYNYTPTNFISEEELKKLSDYNNPLGYL